MSEQPRPRYALSLGLFLATFATTTAHGAMNVHPGGALFPLADGLSYSIPLLAILLFHEFGHYVAARLHRVPASLPYFIPLPPPVGLLGTMGAVILQGGTTDRRKLMDIGAAGPLAGMVAAIPIMIYGLSLSTVTSPSGILQQEGNSLLYALLKFAVKGEWLPHGGRDVMLHPTAFAAWAGFLVTMLNLIPVGQLDGGHVATAYFGDRYERVSRFVHRALPVLAVSVGLFVYQAARDEIRGAGAAEALHPAEIALGPVMFWLLWFGVLWLMRRMSGGVYHPPVDPAPLGRRRRALFWIVLVTFVLVFMPVPFRFSIGPADDPTRGTPPAQSQP